MLLNPNDDVLSKAMSMKNEVPMNDEQSNYWIKKSRNDLLGNMAAIPVGAVEAFFGLPGDVVGLARGGYDAYNADEGQGWDAFSKGFEKPTGLPTTMDIQQATNPYLPKMIQEGDDGRLLGEFAAPGGYLQLLKKLYKGKNMIAGGGLIGGGTNIE